MTLLPAQASSAPVTAAPASSSAAVVDSPPGSPPTSPQTMKPSAPPRVEEHNIYPTWMIVILVATFFFNLALLGRFLNRRFRDEV
ncbi:MAG: hypothetical protein ABR532_06690 [Candidatus Dormibacteria bacterium]